VDFFASLGLKKSFTIDRRVGFQVFGGDRDLLFVGVEMGWTVQTLVVNAAAAPLVDLRLSDLATASNSAKERQRRQKGVVRADFLVATFHFESLRVGNICTLITLHG